MKTGILILLIAGCVLLPGVSYASVSSPAPRQSSRNSATSDAASDHLSDAEYAAVSSQNKDKKETIASNKRASSRRHVPAKISPHSRVSLKRTYRPKHVQHNHEHSGPEDVRSMHQQVQTKPNGAASKVVTIHTLPGRPATGVAISGQQFRSGRNRSASPAAIGGPANTRRNTAAIDGTEVNRKHSN